MIYFCRTQIRVFSIITLGVKKVNSESDFNENSFEITKKSYLKLEILSIIFL